jgi:hypothetical protein
MIEFFAIFGKGGLVIWYFNEGKEMFKDAVNSLISDVLLQVCLQIVGLKLLAATECARFQTGRHHP